MPTRPPSWAAAPKPCCRGSRHAGFHHGIDDQAGDGRSRNAAGTGLLVDAMMKSGVPAGDAAKIAELMLEADLTGADAHGVFRLPQYVQRLKLGSTNARPNITVTRSAPATALVDGDNGMGHLAVSY